MTISCGQQRYLNFSKIWGQFPYLFFPMRNKKGWLDKHRSNLNKRKRTISCIGQEITISAVNFHSQLFSPAGLFLFWESTEVTLCYEKGSWSWQFSGVIWIRSPWNKSVCPPCFSSEKSLTAICSAPSTNSTTKAPVPPWCQLNKVHWEHRPPGRRSTSITQWEVAPAEGKHGSGRESLVGGEAQILRHNEKNDIRGIHLSF